MMLICRSGKISLNKSVEQRDAFKKIKLKDTELGLNPKAADKIMQIVCKRRKSRLSNNNFTNVDFDYQGNTNSFSHLIKGKFNKAVNSSLLNFECRLRSYKSKAECKQVNNWVNTFTKPTKREDGGGKPPVYRKVKKVIWIYT
jgi:hypothetical protein